MDLGLIGIFADSGNYRSRPSGSRKASVQGCQQELSEFGSDLLLVVNSAVDGCRAHGGLDPCPKLPTSRN